MKNFANFSLKLFAFMSILVFFYTIYRAEIHFSDFSRDFIYAKYLKYIILSIFFSSFFFLLLKLNNEFKANIVICIYSLIIGFYIAEFVLLYNFNYLPQKKTKVAFNQETVNSEITRIKKIKNLLQDEIYPFTLFDEIYINKDQSIYPLGNLSNSNIHLCNELGKNLFYKSDRYGFRNPDKVWDNKIVEYVLIGDSFVQGACVQDVDTMSNLIKKKTNKNVINLGIGGNGPLKEYATFLEFAVEKKPKKVLWFFYEGNDLTKDLRHEKEIKILMNYINKNENQNLKYHQVSLNNLMKKKIIEEVHKKEIEIRDFKKKKDKKVFTGNIENFLQNTKFLRLWAVRSLIKNSFGRESIDPLFKEILNNTNKIIKEWNGELYFIYLPEKRRYSNKFNFYVSKDNFRNKKDVINIARNLNIKFIDIDKKVFRKFEDPIKLFHGHYNEKGYSLIVDEILDIN